VDIAVDLSCYTPAGSPLLNRRGGTTCGQPHQTARILEGCSVNHERPTAGVEEPLLDAVVRGRCNPQVPESSKCPIPFVYLSSLVPEQSSTTGEAFFVGREL